MALDNALRAQTRAEALPHIQKYSGKTILIKYGGNAMQNEELKRLVMGDIVLLSMIGIRVVVVHGGGPEISDMLNRTGKQSEFVDGLRVTDSETMDIVQLTANFRGVFKLLPATGRGRMSRNGQWYVYVDRGLVEGTNTFKSTTYRINLLTGETEEIPTPMLTSNFESTQIEPDGISAVSDDGQYIIFESGGNVTSALTRDGEIIPVAVPEGYHHAWLINLDADASVLIGSVMKERAGGGYWATPCKWVDGEPIVLDAPQADAINWVTSELDTYPRGCSEDGSIVYGSEWQTFGLCYWTADNKLHNIGIENAEITGTGGNTVINMIEVQASYWNISNNGKWIVTKYAKNYPVRVNTLTNTYEILDNLPGMSGSCAPPCPGCLADACHHR